MECRVTPVTTEVDFAAMSRDELVNFRRSLMGCLAIVEMALKQQGLTFTRKERTG